MADYGQEASEYLDSKSINSDQPTLVSNWLNVIAFLTFYNSTPVFRG